MSQVRATVFTNANVITCDARGTVARAVDIADGRIVAVGDEDDLRSCVMGHPAVPVVVCPDHAVPRRMSK